MEASTLDVSKMPTLEIAEFFLKELCEEEHQGCFPGEKLQFSHLKDNEFGFELLEITTGKVPDYGSEEYDADLYDEVDSKAVVCLNVMCNTYPGLAEGKDSELLATNLKKWLLTKEDGEKYDDSEMKVVEHTIVDRPPFYGKKEVAVTIVFQAYTLLTEKGSKILSSPFNTKFWDPLMNKMITEGVCYSKVKVGQQLRDSLRENIGKLAAGTAIDYHPNSNEVVRDLVHPSLFPYVDGVSKFREGKSKTDIICADEYKTHDFWGRKYENSTYQWLPTPFHISEDGKCTIAEYINNLDRIKFPALYGDLSQLFECFLPYFEEVWSYSKAMEFWNEQTEENFAEVEPIADKTPVSFKGKELQVITKIVEYKLKPDQTYEGVWHVEGMSHENIVMTGIYFIDRDEDMLGGELRYERAFQHVERNKILMSVPQERPIVLNNFAAEGVMPLGHFPTEEGYMLVFPNCHIHKISKLINSSKTGKDVRRRIVVFFVVNPENKIISTAEIAPQQNVVTLETALQYRLNMMEERKYQKENFNTRDIELCEH